MPELPDIELYRHWLGRTVVGQAAQSAKALTPFVLRTVVPPLSDLVGRRILDTRRIGKRVVLEAEGQVFAVVHLMVAGRFRWLAPGAKPPAKISHLAIGFETGTLVLTEASSKKRAGVWMVASPAELASHDPGGLEPLDCGPAAFTEQLRSENRTLKRALTDPRLFAGIGNAYSDEILFAARLSPLKLTSVLTDNEAARLHEATVRTLNDWSRRLRDEFKSRFPGPGDVTAFRPDFAVHGRYRQPCPVCSRPVQRIVYAENETDYCAQCQNEGRILADRSLSRLLKDDWPRSFDE
jgi:formamidopyrimidine-DNA glycosylase